MKNKELIAINIEEAKEELENILSELVDNSEFSEVELKIALEHIYHHLNFSWNIRNVDEKIAVECSEQNFREWSKYPVGEILEYE